MSKMFSCPPTESETQNNNKVTHKTNKRKRKKKSGGRNFRKVNKKQGKLALSMSAWAENFTLAATWQLKHQLAYWKARAKALEYENGVLHDIIRKNNYIGPSDTHNDNHSDGSDDPEYSTQMESETEEYQAEEEEGEEDFEVSEEFIQFLRENAKYKEDARRERERLKAKYSEKEHKEEMEAGPSECPENREETLNELYGDKWQRICALETAIESNFINETDKDKPLYWPNIPFNFNFG